MTLFGALSIGFGCNVPAPNPARTAAMEERAKKAAKPPVVPARSGGEAPVPRLTVQGEIIDAEELWLGKRAELETKSDELSPDQFERYVAEQAAVLVTDKLAEMLLYQKATLRLAPEMERRVDQYVDAEIRKIVTADYDGVQRRYEKGLESEGQTIDDVRRRIRRAAIVAGYLEAELKPKVADPTRAELWELYQTNRDAWAREERRSMSLIDVRLDEHLPKDVSEPTREQQAAAKAEAKSKANAALLELRNGADFADVARRHSSGARADEGGAWGWIKSDSVRERFLPAVQTLGKLRQGQVSDLVETPDGFFIVRCDALEPAFVPDFETVQPELKEQIFRRRYNELIARFVNELRAKAKIDPPNLERFHAAVVDAAMNMLRPQ